MRFWMWACFALWTVTAHGQDTGIEKGRLFAQFGRNGSLDGPQADYIVQTHVPGENRF